MAILNLNFVCLLLLLLTCQVTTQEKTAGSGEGNKEEQSIYTMLSSLPDFLPLPNMPNFEDLNETFAIEELKKLLLPSLEEVKEQIEEKIDNFLARKEALDPEAHMGFCEIAMYHGYGCTEYLHKVATIDGFLLTLHRITGRRNSTKAPGYPVFVQHGLLCDSTSWILNARPNDNLPFALADRGYDVWLGNSRGNTYSLAHKSLNPDEQAFWAWSWDEMALYDLPASIDFVLNHTRYKTLFYVGHSQGTLSAFVYLSVSYTTKISHMVAMGPVFNVYKMVSPIRYLAPISKDLSIAFALLGVKDFLPSSKLVKFLAAHACASSDLFSPICADILFVIAGFDRQQLNTTRLPVILSHVPAGTSVQNLLHFAQMVLKKSTDRFDYGSAAANQKHYHQDTPPKYDISTINSTTISLLWAENDWLADPEDVKFIRRSLKTITDDIYVPKWDHLDFLWALDVRPTMIDPVLQILGRKLGGL